MKLAFRSSIFLLTLWHTNAWQNLFGGKGSLIPPPGNKPAPLCDRVDLGSLSVSPMGFGTLNLPLDKESDDETTSVIKVASDLGVNLVDTAEAVSNCC